MSFAHYIKAIGSAGNRDLSEQEACELFAAMLDGGVADLELGAILLTYKSKTESLEELLGFHAALSQRVFHLRAPDGKPQPVILSSYNGARTQPNLLPLLALLLQRLGMPVLVHGTLNGDSGVASAYIFRELGVLPSVSLAQAQDALDNRSIAFVPTAVLSPGLADLLSTRARLGVRSSPHLLAKLIDPFDSGGLCVVSATEPVYLALLREFLLASGARALLLQSTDGEPFADPRRRPQIESFDEGVGHVLFEAENGPQEYMPNLPASPDAITTAAWIRQALAGGVSVPLPIIHQLACCLFAAGYSSDMNQAKALVAVETANLSVA